MAIKPNLTRAMLLVCVLTISSFGCNMRPNFGPPGSIYEQRARAVLSDPFPNNDLGPAVMGGRPRGYDLPLPEPTNIQASPYAKFNKNRHGPLWRIFHPQSQNVPPVAFPATNGYPATTYPPASYSYPTNTNYPPATYPPAIYPQSGNPPGTR